MADEFWYLWYEYRAFRVFMVLLVCVLIALLAWLLLIRPSSGDSTSSTVQAGGGAVGVTEPDIAVLSQQLQQPVYWAGPMPGTTLELTETDAGFVYIRYLTGNAQPGTPSRDFLTVGTYSALNAFNDLRAYARHAHANVTHIAHGGLALPVPGSPTSVFFAYPHEDLQVEVYDPQPHRALDLVKSGLVVPVSGFTSTQSAGGTVVTPSSTVPPSTTPTTAPPTLPGG